MKPELKKLLVLNLPYLLFVYLFAKCGQAYRLAAGVDASAKLLYLTGGISVAFASPLPSLHLFDLCVGVVGAVAVRLIVYSKGKNAKKYRNLYELDYQQHFQHIREAALPVGANRLIYESGMREIGPKEHFDSRPDKYFGEFVRYEMQPREPELLQAVIRQEQRSREPAQPGDFKEHLAALHTGLIEAEAQRIATDMKRLAAPNSPDKNHFMVEVSPYFTKLASSRDTDQLLAMLPYKSLRLSSVKDRFGIYALVDKKENRDRGIRKPRASVRKQLSETKQAASPKKAAARSKQHEMEV